MSITLGEALRIRRKRKAWTQALLAAKSGVDQVTISDIERARTKTTSWDKLLALATALETSPQDFLTIELTEDERELLTERASA